MAKSLCSSSGAGWARWGTPVFVLCALAMGLDRLQAGPTNAPLSLAAAVQSALLHNRDLQIERINAEVAAQTLAASHGVYDPVLLAQARRENISDSGAFDPANPAVESGYSTRSDVAGVAVSGLLPSGLMYDLTGNFAHSTGSRNFLNFDAYRVASGITLQQPLLRNAWIDLPRLAIRVSKRNLKISEEGVRYVAMTVLNLVQQGYFELIFAWDQLGIQLRLLDNRDRLLRGIQRQIELGKLTVLEEHVALAHQARVHTDLLSASNLVALAGNNLRTLMGVTGPDWTEQLLMPADPPRIEEGDLDLASSWQRGLARRPDLVQLTKGAENAALNLQYRRNQLFPGLDIIGAYGRRGADSVQAFPPDEPRASASSAFRQIGRGAAPSDMIGLVLTVPFSFTAERANFRAGRELKKQAELLVKQREELILREISDAIHTVRFGAERMKAARRATEFAESALQAEESKLAGGKSSIPFVIQFQFDLTTARLQEVQARLDYLKALSQLHFAEGTILERNKVEIEFE